MSDERQPLSAEQDFRTLYYAIFHNLIQALKSKLLNFELNRQFNNFRVLLRCNCSQKLCSAHVIILD